MDNFAITAADAVSRRYKSNDPEAIIAQRAIKIKDIRFCEELLEEIAQVAGVEKNFVDFKLNILTAKGYQLPAVPELKSNFLKDSMKNCSKCYD